MKKMYRVAKIKEDNDWRSEFARTMSERDMDHFVAWIGKPGDEDLAWDEEVDFVTLTETTEVTPISNYMGEWWSVPAMVWKDNEGRYWTDDRGLYLMQGGETDEDETTPLTRKPVGWESVDTSIEEM